MFMPLKPDELTRLRFILDQAGLKRMMVDVSFTYDIITFDIQNERNVSRRAGRMPAGRADLTFAVRF